jgi:hypothetical protein
LYRETQWIGEGERARDDRKAFKEGFRKRIALGLWIPQRNGCTQRQHPDTDAEQYDASHKIMVMSDRAMFHDVGLNLARRQIHLKGGSIDT